MKEVYLKINMIEEPMKNIQEASNYKTPGVYLVKDNSGESYVVRYRGDNLCINSVIGVSDVFVMDVKSHEGDIERSIEQAVAMERANSELERDRMKLEYENPKRNQCGEWISGKTLKDIITILTNHGER